MFQYAFAYALSLKWKTQLLIETSFFDGNNFPSKYNAIDRSFELDIFSVNGKKITEEKIEKLLNRKYSKFWTRVPFFEPLKLIRESTFGYFESFINLKPPVCLDGYFQSEKYFLNFQEEIKTLFTFPMGLLNNETQKKVSNLFNNPYSVSIHVRRGDYVSDAPTQSFHGICGLEYYENAMALIRNKIPKAEFFLFTDSPEIVKNEFKAIDNFQIMSDGDYQYNWVDMYLMSQCKHHIIANSSYSWWGAWLGINPEKIVVAPQKWFAVNEVDYSNVVPESWEKI